MYANTTSKVRTQGIESDWIEIQSGVRHGDVLSPLLFIIFMDNCLTDRTWNVWGRNHNVCQWCSSNCQFYYWHPGGSKQMVVWNESKRNEGKHNIELVVVSRIPELHEIYMDYYKINETKNYYLDVNIGEKNLQEGEMHNRIAKYNCSISMMFPLLKVNAHCMRHNASRYIAMRHVVPYAFLSVNTGKALPDIFSYNGVTKTRHASRSHFTNSGNSLNCIAKTKKKRQC